MSLSVNCNILARRVEQPYLVTNRTHSKEMCFSLWGLECCLVRPHTLCRETPTRQPAVGEFPTKHALSRSSLPILSFPALCAHMYPYTRFIYLPLSLTFFHFFSLLNEGSLGSETAFLQLLIENFPPSLSPLLLSYGLLPGYWH